ncbi:MAG: hypothetical protein ACKVOU_11040 [Cytophagales bacterium]
MKILDAVHTNDCNLRITFLEKNKKIVKDVDLQHYLKDHPNIHTRKMANEKILSDIDIHLDYLSWKGNVLDIDVNTLYRL